MKKKVAMAILLGILATGLMACGDGTKQAPAAKETTESAQPQITGVVVDKIEKEGVAK